ncbi:MAG TPA: AAA family ATPase, partial [Spirochaetota bacterium]|nr:AAA family ATPase [Spirochaetota bacterium]
MGKVISVSNQKGGVGKTTTTVNVAAFIAGRGRRVLIIDIDPQANAGYGVGVKADEAGRTIYEVLVGTISIKEAVVTTSVPDLYLIPSNIHLAGAQMDLLDMEGKEYILREAIRDI